MRAKIGVVKYVSYKTQNYAKSHKQHKKNTKEPQNYPKTCTKNQKEPQRATKSHKRPQRATKCHNEMSECHKYRKMSQVPQHCHKYRNIVTNTAIYPFISRVLVKIF